MTLSSPTLPPPLPHPAARLEEPLPPDVVAGVAWGPFRYRRYPVFSWRWLLGRFWLSAMAVGLYGALTVLGGLASGLGWQASLAAAGYFFLGMMLMLTVGPALATWVRRRGLPARREAGLVVVAVVVGFIAALSADAWSSRRIMAALGDKEVPEAERRISEADEAAIALARLGGFFLYFAFGGGLACFAYFSERRRLAARSAHLALRESDMRLAVLQAQVEPHFLFNTLAAIRPLIRQDAARAESAIDALAAHLRATIPLMRESSRALRCTLSQQLDICASYLDLMEVRMGDRLQREIVVPEELHAAEFPPLMLLSLVENAIKHGLEPKPGAGRLGIQAGATGPDLKVSVTDDGVGLKDGLSAGLGLANIREQLALRYPGRASLKVATRAEGGTVAEIVIPRLDHLA